jgi:hypothetical protein
MKNARCEPENGKRKRQRIIKKKRLAFIQEENRQKRQRTGMSGQIGCS